LAAIGAQNTDENVNLNFSITATDIESTPTFTSSALPGTATFTDNGDGTATFDWTPSFADSGSYDITFTAVDDSSATDFEIVTITVNQINLDPVLATIGAQNIDEGANLNFTVTASDPDGITPVLTTSTLPTGATFIAGVFDWTPDYTQSGSYDITFTATDDSLVTDFEVVTITVNQVNLDPVLTAIGAQSTTENINLSFAVSASDPDGATPVLTSSTLPGTATFIAGVFDWTPSFTDAGSYNVTFYATDDSAAADSETVTITVIEAGNQIPVLAAIGVQSTTENVNLTFGISASDVDATIPILTTSTLPGTATFIDNTDGTGTFSWTPSFTDAGSYNVTFYATDGGGLIDSEIVVITVNEIGNQAPILASIGAQSTTENVNLTFGVTASDIDATIPNLSTSTLPTGATFVDNTDGTGTFNWTPDFLQSGSYDITFYADDGALLDSEIVTITVIDGGNQLPILAGIGAQNTDENVNLNFIISATDIESVPTFTSSTLPGTATFIDNGDGTGTFNWTPLYNQAGSYDITFTATDDSSATDFEIVTITIIEAGNQEPILTAIGSQSIVEGSNLNFAISASDPDSTIPPLTTSTLPTGASFTDNTDGTGNFSWTPDFTQAGAYFVTFYADDGIVIDSEVVAINVFETGNQAPVIATVSPQSTTENILLTFGITSSDPDGTTPVLSSSTLPTGATYVDNTDGTGTFSWTPDFLQSGVYNIDFYATDGVLSDTESVAITVNDGGNQLPILAAIGAQNTDENVNLNFSITATDIESTPTFTSSALPGTATFTDNGDGTATFDWTPSFADSGSYDITFTAVDDSSATDFEIVTITVNQINLDPVLATIGAQNIDEGANLNFTVTASDPDGITPVLTTSTLPTGATFIAGVFDWTPDYTQSGSYDITFTATDDSLVTDFEVVTITVNQVNLDPVLTAIGAQSTTENINLSFAVSASDPDGATPVLTSSTLPGTATFIAGVFDWTPSFTDAGSYNVTFYATDDSAAADSETVTITVIEAGNQIPVLAAIGVQSTTENVNLTFGISASDVDATIPILTTSTLPGTATFIDNTDGTGTFSWTPSFTDAGSYNVTFYATDGGGLIDSEIVVITVNEIGNQAPILASIGAQSTTENVNLTFGVTASDIDATIPNLSTSTLPTGATFVDNTDGTGTFNWTPDFLQSGSYDITFYADDGALLDSEIVTITVIDGGNQLPILAGIGAQNTDENVNLNFIISATDIESVPTFTSSTLPGTATFIDNGDGTGTFNWTPLYNQAGSYDITFTATDDSSATDFEIVTITVNQINLDPVLASIGAQNTDENVLLTFGVSASDPDGINPTLTTSTLPIGASFIDNGDGTGTFDWTPDYTQAGSYDITFTATDDSLITDFEIVTITVNQVNLPPILVSIGLQSTVENTNLNFAVTSSDPDGDIPTLTTSTLPTGASFVDNGDGTGTFDWTPDFTQAGAHSVTFYATDDSLEVDLEVVTITVIETGNQAPVIATVGPQSTNENTSLNFTVTATDPDETIPVITSSTLPSGATFVAGVFDWTPNFLQSGVYNVDFYATDGVLSDTESVVITIVEVGNQLPILAGIGAQTVDENVNLNFTITATDIESIPTLTTSALPGTALFTDNGDGTGTFDWTPSYADSGVYSITFTATDDSAATDFEVVTLTINQINLDPVLATIGAQNIDEGVNLNFAVTSTDPDGIFATLTTTALPTGASFIDNGDGTGTFDWTPDYTQTGSYDVTFTATDDSLVTDIELVTITVNQVNLDPVLAAIGAQSTNEDVNLNFVVTSSDFDGQIPVLTTSALPTGATFTDNSDGSGAFNWTPNFLQAGIYDVTFYATDDSAAADSETVTITVNEDGNQLPILAGIGAQNVDENALLTFDISASDIESTPTLTTSVLPTGAVFSDNGDGTGNFNWTPTYSDSGSYDVTFTATDDSLATDFEIVTITVNQINLDPVLAAIGAQNIDEGANLNCKSGQSPAYFGFNWSAING